MGLAVHRRERGDVAERSDEAPAHLGGVRLTAVFYHLDPTLVRDLNNRLDLTGLAEGVHDEGGARGWRHPPEERLGPGVVASRLTVDQPGTMTVEDDRGDRPGVGDRRDQHVAALRQIERGHGDEERRGPRRDGVGVPAAHHGHERIRVVLLEVALVAGIEVLAPVELDDLVHHLHFGVAQGEPRWHRILSDGLPAVDGQP